MKLRFFYKIDPIKKKPVLASNIRRKTKPPGKFWGELPDFCCESLTIPCTCGPRYFVQVDNSGNPVDFTIIKRTIFPHPEEGIFYKEISWTNPCCQA